MDGIAGLSTYPWWHATRAELLRRLGRDTEAGDAYARALALELNEPRADHLRRRLASLSA